MIIDLYRFYRLVVAALVKTILVTETNITDTELAADWSQPSGSITSHDESLQQEVKRAKASLLGPKANICLGAWNVHTMFETSKPAQIISKIKRYRLDILLWMPNYKRWYSYSLLRA